MISYTRPWSDINVTVPVLHRVHFCDAGVNTHIRDWCYENCKQAFYIAPSWTQEFFVEFDDDQDAVAFALRWA